MVKRSASNEIAGEGKIPKTIQLVLKRGASNAVELLVRLIPYNPKAFRISTRNKVDISAIPT